MERLKVLIVAKTRRGGGACIGGITLEGRSVRLQAATAGTDEQANLVYQVGEVWEVEVEPPASLTPPHTETLVVLGRRRLGPMSDLPAFVAQHMAPVRWRSRCPL